MAIMLEVKSRTAAYHADTERLLREKLFKNGLSQSCYLRVISAFHRAYSSLEGVIADYPVPAQLLKKRSKLELLEKDLIYLRNATKTARPLIFIDEPPHVANEAVALGVLYVMEGSTLGGKIINKYLMQHEWMSVDLIGNFFNNYGDDCSRMWKEFGCIVDGFSHANSLAADHLVNGARLAFQYIHSVLSQV